MKNNQATSSNIFKKDYHPRMGEGGYRPAADNAGIKR